MHPTQGKTECRQQTFSFQGLGGRRVEADFSGGHLSSEGGALLLREVDRIGRFSEQLAGCFTDRRDARFVEHELPVLLRQRVMGLALGYEDINDHERLRLDPLLATVCGRSDVLGLNRRQEVDKGKPLAGKSTLNRLELGEQRQSRLHKIHLHAPRMEALLLKMGVKAIPRRSDVIILDFDATDDRIHGNQEGRFYHGYYGDYCYLPLYCFCGDIPLWAQLRTSGRDASDGTVEALQKIVPAIRERFGKHVMIVVRGDSGFCRDEIMDWIEGQPNMRYVFGLARNKRLEAMLAPWFWEAAAKLDEDVVLCAKAAGAHEPPEMEGSARVFAELRYRVLVIVPGNIAVNIAVTPEDQNASSPHVGMTMGWIPSITMMTCTGFRNPSSKTTPCSIRPKRILRDKPPHVSDRSRPEEIFRSFFRPVMKTISPLHRR